MAEETKIAMKLEKELEPIKKMCETLEDAAKHELSKGIENVDAKELGEVVDMIKDLYEAKKFMVESCYYKQIMEKMEEHDFDDEEDIMDEGRRGYRGQPRSQSGRYMSRGDGRRSNRGRGSRRGYESSMMEYDDMDYEDMQYMRDMDRPYGRMGYSGSGSSGGSSMGGSTSGQSGSSNMGGGSSNSGQMGYSDGGRDRREGRSGQSRRGYMEAKEQGKDKQQKMKELEDYMKELSTDVTEMIGDASPEEKSLLKQKMQVLMQKIG